MQRNAKNERGAILVMSLIICVTLAGLTAVFLTRTLYEHDLSNVRGDSLTALYQAYGKLAKAEALLNRAWYDPETGRNLVLQEALRETPSIIQNTEVLVEPVGDPDESIFFNLVATAKVGRVTRKVNILMSEKQSFADYNYFVNSHPLGISGVSSPRGSIHTNDELDFYFPNGRFPDAVTASGGFGYQAGATPENTQFLGPMNAQADRIDDLLTIDIPAMMTSADYAEADPDLDTLIVFDGDHANIVKKTQAGYVEVPRYVDRQVQVGEREEVHDWDEPVYRTEVYYEVEPVLVPESYTYFEEVPVYGPETYTYNVYIPVYEQMEVEKQRSVPVYATRTVTRTSTEVVWIPDENPDAVGGTAIAGGEGAEGPGHFEVQEISWEEQETYVDHYDTEFYTVTESVRTGTNVEERTGTRTVQIGTETVERQGVRMVQVGEETVEKSREVVDYMEAHTETVMVPIFETVTVQEGTRWVWQDAQIVQSDSISANGIIYLEGDVVALEGELNGKVTIVTHGGVRITGSLVYVDGDGDPAYLNGDDPNAAYEPNPAYDGTSVLGVIAENDILYTPEVPLNFELNGSFLAKQGRIGITGIRLDEAGKASLEENGEVYIKNSIRRLGGVISNLRPVATFIDDDYQVKAGFLRGISYYDRQLQFRPPVGFPGRRRPKKLSLVATEVIQ